MEIRPEPPDRNSTGEAYREMVTKKSAESEPVSAEIAPAIEWGKIDNPADARRALEAAHGAVLSASTVFGDGSEFIKDKDRMVGVPFIVCDWHFNVDPSTDREYVNVLVMNANGDKARFNDGSTGVYAQLKKVSEEFGVIGIECKFGLRKSEYEVEIDGKKQKATTYYLAG